jgi:hypothetical protein
MRLSFILSFLVLLGGGATAAEGILVVGIGRSSCANWQSSPENAKEGTAWIFGLWSGLNSINPKNRQVGSRSDARGIAAEVKKLCDDKPSLSLHEATVMVYTAMFEGK